ncbi:hypothetical protein EE612_047633, partial [Oryza sativa]
LLLLTKTFQGSEGR